ncbi:hypothetical protein [Allomuricauda sp. M10]|uniref:hypothetical protein n=1 Tax=Allomuricauda sp. M10 TaxID=2683292 RepID=UPI001D17E3C6|nr:hypothetical protein [Muricauda sp. M10]
MILLVLVIPLHSQQAQEKDLCSQLVTLVERDQQYRGTNDIIADHVNQVLDSLIQAKGLTPQQFEALPAQEQGPTKQLAIKIAGQQMKPIITNDSLAQLKLALDLENTKTLIDLVQKHGWLTSKNLGCSQSSKTVLIFRHAPKVYWEQVREIIENEKAANRISGYEYYVIDNHLKGRPPMTKKYADFTNE